MPRYFIDTDNGDQFVLDEEGQELPDPGAARGLALTALSEMARDTLSDRDQRTLTATVRDKSGRAVYSTELELRGRWAA